MATYTKVSAAEKYAELERLGQDRPVCECHGEAMGWAAGTNYTSGGYWRCRIKKALANRKFVLGNPGTAEEARAWREANPERCRYYRKRAYKKAKERGVCPACGENPVPGRVYCRIHAGYIRDWSRLNG